MRPAIGGLCVGGLAIIIPAVLSSGHSALHVGFDAYYIAPVLVMLIGLKVLAAAISIGSGFRGGLVLAQALERSLTHEPSAVQPANSISATSSGFSQTTSLPFFGAPMSVKGDVCVSATFSFRTSISSFFAR